MLKTDISSPARNAAATDLLFGLAAFLATNNIGVGILTGLGIACALSAIGGAIAAVPSPAK